MLVAICPICPICPNLIKITILSILCNKKEEGQREKKTGQTGHSIIICSFLDVLV
jgi:hypothetical protein